MTVVLVMSGILAGSGAGMAIGYLLARARSAGELALARDRAQRAARSDTDLREAFGALSAEALDRSAETLVRLAEQRLTASARLNEADLHARQQAIDAMLEPLRLSLDQVHQQLHGVERGRSLSDTALREQLGSMRRTSEQLRAETAQLVSALRAPQVRGRWGELQLERVVEAAGMTEHVDYDTQVSSAGEDGTVRPDLVVRLVGGKRVVVDSKVAFGAYLDAVQARDEATKAARLKAHARHLRDHIDALAAKAYWQRFTPTPEFVVCFVPADAFLDAALQQDPGLLEHAFARDVVLATPSTLVALLRTVAYTWRQDALADNAAQVHALGRELYQRLAGFGAHLGKLGRSLSGAVESYNGAVASLESRVLVSARKLAELHVVAPGQDLDAPAQVTVATRAVRPTEHGHRLVALAPSEHAARSDPPGA